MSMDCPGAWTVQEHGLSRSMDFPGAWTVQEHGLSRSMDCSVAWTVQEQGIGLRLGNRAKNMEQGQERELGQEQGAGA